MGARNEFSIAYKSLNTAQKKAVDTVEGPLMVIAGPGSGKTQILALRVANILKKTHATPGNIVCLTFTDSAAENMRERLASFIGERAYRVAIHTFHSFATEIINRHPEYFYGGACMAPADDVVRLQIVERAIFDLPHGHPLRSLHPREGFVYTKPVLRLIEHVKKAGLSPEEFSLIIETNEKDAEALDPFLTSAFDDRVSKKDLARIEGALRSIDTAMKGEEAFLFPHMPWKRYWKVVFDSLERALNEAKAADSTTPLSEWKSEWTEKGEDGARRLKDRGDRLIRMKELGAIYARYKKELYEEGYFDFDDMILDVIKAVETIPSLQSYLQETYQYMLVDEFQDTNDAQMRLIRAIADVPHYDKRPNIMVVGDDDQAVYRFQGADISNIGAFKDEWKDVLIVTMTDNYRSTEDILSAAMSVIRRGENRLEKIIPGIEKELRAAGSFSGKGQLTHTRLSTKEHEYHFVASDIKKRIEKGEKPKDIAIIGRKHSELEALVPYLKSFRVPVRYEREQNVLEEPHIRQIVTIAAFLSSVARKEKDEADDLLPEILSYPFWGISRIDVWRVARVSREKRIPWLSAMKNVSDAPPSKVADFLIELAAYATYEPVEKVIDKIVGAHEPVITDADEDEVRAVPSRNDYKSPFKSYYFSKERFTHARADYLSFLSSLRTFVRALREYKRGKTVSLDDLVEFVQFREKNNLPLNDVSPFANAEEAVSLFSAHKAKGLEFETVYILSAHDSTWAGRGDIKRLSLPKNLPIEPAGDTDDDKIRLFYVALTRAKKNLILVSSESKDDGGKEAPLRYLLPKDEHEAHPAFSPVCPLPEEVPDTTEILEAAARSFHTPPFLGEEEALLKNLLRDYSLPVTHLNNFLDVPNGGPQKFLENNVLRFPQAKTPSAAYGTAVHEALARLGVYVRERETLPREHAVLKWFEEALARERLGERDFRREKERGKKALPRFFREKRGEFKPTDESEVDFAHEHIVVQGARITGKIDRIIKEENGVFVVDYKTGQPYLSWERGSDEEKQRLRAYERQLFFYKILVEHSRSFLGMVAKGGALLFVEPWKGQIIELRKDFDAKETERLVRLMKGVFDMIQYLRFPIIDRYSRDLAGIVAFEEDILSGKCVFEEK